MLGYLKGLLQRGKSSQFAFSTFVNNRRFDRRFKKADNVPIAPKTALKDDPANMAS